MPVTAAALLFCIVATVLRISRRLALRAVTRFAPHHG